MTSVPHSGAKSVTPGGSVAGGHTKGPWKVFTVKDGPNKGQLLGVGEENGAGVADAHGGLWGSGAEKMANARLIAAAPELLAVAIKSHEPYVGLDEEDIRCLYGADEADLAMALREAITKATAGETRNAEPIHRRDGDAS